MDLRKVFESKKKVEDAIEKLKDLKKMELSDIEDKIRELEAMRDSISVDYDCRIISLEKELEIIKKAVIVDTMKFEVDDNYCLTSTLYNCFNEPIAVFEIKDIRKSFIKVHYDAISSVIEEELDIKDYVNKRLGYSYGVELEKFKLFFAGMSYPIKLNIL